jgi:hypothetical protein
MAIKPYDHTTYPSNGALGSSAALRNELDAIEAGFDMVATEIETALTGSETAAATATTQAGIATTQAEIATTQAGLSATQAGISTTQAGISTTQAGIATTQAANALASANSAAATLNTVNTVYDNFDDRYLGAKAVEPTLDNDGNALQVGAMYFDTVMNTFRGYTSLGTWVSLLTSVASTIQNTPAGNITETNVQDALNQLDGFISDLEASKVSKTSDTGSAILPSGTTAQRDAVPDTGYLRFNETLGKPEVYNGTAWGSVGGGATGGGADEIFIENGQHVTQNYTIPSTRNAMSTGPITIDSGVVVTVSAGARWVVL